MKMAYVAPEVKEHQMIQFETAQSWNCAKDNPNATIPDNNGNGSNFPNNCGPGNNNGNGNGNGNGNRP
ncbi:hypothetical protein JMA_33700 [Jeotgalibacillus malaysiensis]|uniref:Uncharacterized protein n=1 Tax=Jeotgalibacillus malaysiensis TaxID=1508404 RepID=A0A0B5AVD3_9BACL|nr:hypothetical protein [Jeotgalibacillus malaysiensis]AJD92687.1 hypothetical protein JMA_33700 [Jeotgalibacillus malaysiensis]